MREIKKGIRVLDGEELETFTTEVSAGEDGKMVTVEAGTNGFHYGSFEQGCRTYFRISDYYRVYFNMADWRRLDMRVVTQGHDGVEGFEVILGGDDELMMIIEALEFIIKTLKDQVKGDL